MVDTAVQSDQPEQLEDLLDLDNASYSGRIGVKYRLIKIRKRKHIWPVKGHHITLTMSQKC